MPPMPSRNDPGILSDWLGDAASRRFIHGAQASVRLGDLAGGTSLGGHLHELAGRSVLIATSDQLTAALALIELDGVARRLTLCPPDLAPGYLPGVMKNAEADAVVTDDTPPVGLPAGCVPIVCR